ncbi:MAG TPA: CPBP family intramembrane glutamic endopeptidase [Woeseiaceae bacterium]
MTVDAPERRHTLAVMLATVCGLFVRAWLELRLRAQGHDPAFATEMSWLLVMPPTLGLLLFPVLRKDRGFLAAQFPRAGLCLRVVARAVVAGLCLRLAWWSQVFAGGALGFYRGDRPVIRHVLQFTVDCPAPGALMLGIVVTATLIPVVEEVTFRGYLLTALRTFGRPLAIVGSAALFAVFHPPSAYLSAFLVALVFGLQYWQSGSLWPPVITHATVNGLVLLDWRCLHGQWHLPANAIPLWDVAIGATLLFFAAAGGALACALRPGHRGDGSPR